MEFFKNKTIQKLLLILMIYLLFYRCISVMAHLDDIVCEDINYNIATYRHLERYSKSQDEDDPYIISLLENSPYHLIMQNIPLCSDIGLIFQRCHPSICKMHTQHGIVLHNIIDKDEFGECIYSEYYVDHALFHCKFNKEEQGMIDNIIDENKFTSWKGRNHLMLNACTIQPEHSIVYHKLAKENFEQKIIYKTVDKSSNIKKESDREIAQSNVERSDLGDKIINSTDALDEEPLDSNSEIITSIDTADHTKIDSASAPNKSNIYNYSNFMFFIDELPLLNKMIEKISTGNAAEIIIKETIQKLKSTAKKVFYLNALLYINKSDWSFWMNDELVDAQNMNEQDFKILSIDSSGVTISWLTRELDFLSPGWRKKLHMQGAKLFLSRHYPIKIAILNDGIASVEFTLQPNQSFDLHNLHIIEGNLLKYM